MKMIPAEAFATFARRLGALVVAAALPLASVVSGASAATPLPPPDLKPIEVLDDDHVYLRWSFVSPTVPVPGGGRRAVDPDGPFGRRLTVTIEQSGERVYADNLGPFPANEFWTTVNTGTYDVRKWGKGSVKDTRYCFGIKAFVGDGSDAGSVFSAERKRCVGTQRILIPSPGQPLPADAPPKPAPPTKPDLEVSGVTGPAEVFDGTTEAYLIALLNEGTPANGTAQITLNAVDALEPVQMVETPDGFTCEDHPLGGFTCTGSLGGVDDRLGERGALFKLQVRAVKSGKASVYGIANHDGSLDEMTGDNNVKLLSVTIK